MADYKELIEILNLYIEFKEDNSIKNSIILLDEITLPKEWFRAIKSLIDRGKFRNDVLIITGSASMLVKREIELFPGRRGKGRDFSIYPLSFRSFVKIIDSELINKIPIVNNLDEIDKGIIYPKFAVVLAAKFLLTSIVLYIEINIHHTT